MKKLTCEMCGNTDVLKQDGVYVCQYCGTKYSVEEAKKMMIEGTVEVQGTVKVDDSSKIDNYFVLARSSFDSRNMITAEDYCNKIIEIDPRNYQAWLLKGQAVGWQSTVKVSRIGESSVCFKTAIDNSPQDMIDSVKVTAMSEMCNLITAIIRLFCDDYIDYPTDVDRANLVSLIADLLSYYKEASNYTGITKEDLKDKIADIISNAVYVAWEQNILERFRSRQHPSDAEFFKFLDNCVACIDILKFAINFVGPSKQTNIKRYETLISITEWATYSCSWVLYDGSYRQSKNITNEAKKENLENIAKYHEKIKSLNPSYEIPNTKQKSGGCYVATAVYGSYDCPQVWTLRRYRDDTLAKTWYGRAFVRTYYAVSPTLVKWFGETEWFKRMWQGKLDKMVEKLQSQGVESTPYEDKNW